jgi:hypothetical protein
LIAAWRSTIELKVPRRMRRRVSAEKKVSTAFSHEPEVGVKWKVQLYRPRLVGHRIGPYAARATAESCSALTASGGLKPCRSISHVAL